MPEEVVHVRYNEQLIRDAVRAFIWRRFVLEQKPLWVLAGAMLVLSLWQFEKGERLWAIIPGIGALLPLLFVLAGWLAHRSASLGRLRAMPKPEAQFAFDDNGFRVTSGAAEVRLPWTSVSEVWARPGAWMLHLAPNQFVTFPTANVPTEMLGRLRGWLGSKVIDL